MNKIIGWGLIVFLSLSLIASIGEAQVSPSYANIVAYSNDDLADFNFPGSGTAENPWIINSLHVTGSGQEYALFFQQVSDYFIISNCSFNNEVYIAGCSNGVLENNSFENQAFQGSSLRVQDSYEMSFNSNVFNEGNVNIRGGGSNNILFENNRLNDINLNIDSQANQNRFVNNTVTGNIVLTGGSYGNVIENNILIVGSRPEWEAGIEGIWIIDSNDNTIANNEIHNYTIGLRTWDSIGNTIEGNRFENCGITIGGNEAEEWSSHKITGNTIGNKEIVYLSKTNGYTVPQNAAQVILAECSNIIVNNLDIEGIDSGILVGYSSTITIENCFINSTKWNGIKAQYSNNITIANNVVNVGDMQGIHLDKTHNSSIKNNTVTDNWDGAGIYCSFGSISNEFVGNTVSGNRDGIQIESATGIVLIGNNAEHNVCGIRLFGFDDGYLKNNNISDNEIGISFNSCYNNTFDGNEITNNNYGMKSSGSYVHRIKNNNFIDNIIGISFQEGNWYYPEDNLIYHNNFIDNGKHVEDFSYGNTWDNGYPSGGNYWEGHDVSDLLSGEYQDSGGPDMMCDKNYSIYGSSGDYDRYPLIESYNGQYPDDNSVEGNEVPFFSPIGIIMIFFIVAIMKIRLR